MWQAEILVSGSGRTPGGEPATGNPVATLTNPGTLTEESLNTFMAPTGTTLDARKTYWITVNEEIAAGSDRVSFARATANDETGEPGWSIGDNRLFRSSETGNWVDSPTSLLIAIKGTTGGITASTDATLSALALADNNGTAISLTPTFVPATTSYTASVANGIDAVTLTATTNDSNAMVAITSDDDTASPGEAELDLIVGSNPLTVTVTAEDGSTTKTYTVAVTRAVPVPVDIEANYPSIGAGLEDLVFTLTRTGAVKDELERTVSIVQAQKWLGASDLSRTVTFALSDEVRTRAPATGKPSIRGTEGTAWVGGTLTVVTKDIEDEDGLSGATYGYQWVRVDADGMSNATDITGETSDTYVPVEADVGKKVRVKVSFTDDGGDNEELTSDAYPSSGTIEAEAPGICERTRQVRVRILDRISRNKCARVTDAHLANITGTLDLSGRSIDTLAAGDFAGLTALTTLNLGSNDLTTLDDDVFDGLTALTGLYLNSNELRTLDDDVFAPLPALTDLRLSTNRLTTLPAGVFAGLTELQELNLSNNKLNTLDAGVFAGLTELTTLRLEGNDLVTLGRRGVRRADRAGHAASGKQRFGHAGRRGVRRADRADDAGSGLQRPDHVARRRVRAADRADGSAVVAQSRGALRAGGGCPAR